MSFFLKKNDSGEQRHLAPRHLTLMLMILKIVMHVPQKCSLCKDRACASAVGLPDTWGPELFPSGPKLCVPAEQSRLAGPELRPATPCLNCLAQKTPCPKSD